MAKIKELRKKAKTELNEILGEKRETLRRFRFAVSGAKTKNIKEARELRRDIARILTLMKE
jgi:ribosomal protein L29